MWNTWRRANPMEMSLRFPCIVNDPDFSTGLWYSSQREAPKILLGTKLLFPMWTWSIYRIGTFIPCGEQGRLLSYYCWWTWPTFGPTWEQPKIVSNVRSCSSWLPIPKIEHPSRSLWRACGRIYPDIRPTIIPLPYNTAFVPRPTFLLCPG